MQVVATNIRFFCVYFDEENHDINRACGIHILKRFIYNKSAGTGWCITVLILVCYICIFGAIWHNKTEFLYEV